MYSAKSNPRPISSLPKYPLLGKGSTGWVFKINNRIVLKLSIDYNSLAMTYENKIYEILETGEPSPYILQSIFRQPGMNFLPFMPGGSLDVRIRASQTRDENDALVAVTKLESLSTVRKWASHITEAAAWLEDLGLAHGDLRPRNMLLDAADNLKLADFDLCAEMGMSIVRTRCPWTRMLQDHDSGVCPAGDDGPWGIHSAKTEQFAIGSVLYFVSRGYEPYEVTDGNQVTDATCSNRVDLWRRGVFPALGGGGSIDAVIGDCWNGVYPTLGRLSEQFADEPRGHCLRVAELAELRSKCEDVAADLAE